MSLTIQDTICKESLIVLEHNKKTKPEKYRVNLLDKEFVQYSNVFPSDLFRDVEIFTSYVVEHSGENFLEIGVGNGITSVMVALKGTQVTGIDINSDSIENANENAMLFHVTDNCNFFKSNVFENLKSERYDTIYWNIPFCDQYVATDSLSKSILDYKYLGLTKFLGEVQSYLNVGGNLIIGYSNIIGNSLLFRQILNQLNYKTKNTLIQTFIEWDTYLFDLTLYEIKF